MLRRPLSFVVVLVGCLLGWMAVPEGQPAADRGANDAEMTLLSGQAAGRPAGSKPGTTPPQGKAVVQAPPLKAPAPTPAPGNPVVTVSTTLGDMTFELFKDQAPVSVENFLQYARDGFYEQTIFHRVVPKFMIQGGGFTRELVEKDTRPPIQNEATNGLRNLRGTVAMARRASLRSATAQFYVNVVDNRMLDHTGYTPADFGYAVFGRVLEGMEVADRIASVPTTTAGGMDNVPVEPVVITGVRIKP
jgi:cyclophilin family peptidyl-prolyl cis-trans isomerase